MTATARSPQHLVTLYKCLCDLNRLRILNLLRTGPECVCRLEAVLGIGPVRTSQQLAYLRRHGMVTCTVQGTWRIYALPEKRPPELEANLACLQDCSREMKVFRDDLVALRKARKTICGPSTCSKD